MGVYALSKRDCTISSRARGPLLDLAPGWRVTLTPDCFLGKEDAEVVEGDAPWPHGTAILVHGPREPRHHRERPRRRRALLPAASHLQRRGLQAEGLPRRRRSRRALARPRVRRLQEQTHRLQRPRPQLPRPHPLRASSLGRSGRERRLVDARRRRGLPRAGTGAPRPPRGGRDGVPQGDARSCAPHDLPRHGVGRSRAAHRLQGPQEGRWGRHRAPRAAGRAPPLAARHRRYRRLARHPVLRARRTPPRW